MTYTIPKTWAAGAILTASEMNTYVRDNTLALVDANPLIIPSARVYNDANISIPHNVATALTFNSERWDTDTIHSTTTNTGRLTCQTVGLYFISGHVQFPAGSNVASIQIRLNGTTYIARNNDPQTSSSAREFSVSTCYSLAAGNYVELLAYQNSGGALNVLYAGNYSPEFGMTYLGKVA